MDRERFMKRKPPLANLSVTELEQMRQEALRIIAACGLYPQGEIESAQDRERQIGCKNKNISTEETHANPGPDE
ncbi:hypothetical protein Bca52824_016039 [Brassica carinata]|uniref:Uncharacterized protein n=1 Tax=Brassica carinata TaxID=52824 RepID=A0A8X7W4E4_BRACI|nr:hypothetical protein Bca52824_016039 [Brassica carinata]